MNIPAETPLTDHQIDEKIAYYLGDRYLEVGNTEQQMIEELTGMYPSLMGMLFETWYMAHEVETINVSISVFISYILTTHKKINQKYKEFNLYPKKLFVAIILMEVITYRSSAACKVLISWCLAKGEFHLSRFRRETNTVEAEDDLEDEIIQLCVFLKIMGIIDTDLTQQDPVITPHPLVFSNEVVYLIMMG